MSYEDDMRSVLVMLLTDESGNHHCVDETSDPWVWVRVGMDFTAWPTVRDVTPAERAVIEAVRRDRIEPMIE